MIPEKKKLRSAVIRTLGDIVVDTEMLAAAQAYARESGSGLRYDFSGMLRLVRGYIGGADFTVANVDGSMGGKYKYGYTGYPQINTPEDLILNLKDAGVDLLTLANNHMLDGWYNGLLAELDHVDAAGLRHTGAFRTREERETPCIVSINGIRVGFLNYTESLNNFENYGVDERALEYGCAWIRNSDFAGDAKKLREAGAEVIVCYMHWGEEYKTAVGESQAEYARQLARAGVDVIVGGHPHVVQHAEWIPGGPRPTFCIYSLGNFLTEHRLENTDGGIIFDFTIREKTDGAFSIETPAFLTTYVWKTGGEPGRGFTVTPCAGYLEGRMRPPGMSDEEYRAMAKSHGGQTAILAEGIQMEQRTVLL